VHINIHHDIYIALSLTRFNLGFFHLANHDIFHVLLFRINKFKENGKKKVTNFKNEMLKVINEDIGKVTMTMRANAQS